MAAAARRGGDDSAHDSGTAPRQRQQQGEDSGEGGEKGQRRRKEGMLTLRQQGSGTPRVADGVNDRLAVHPRLVVHPHAKCSTMVREPRLSLGQPRWNKWRGGSQCVERRRGALVAVLYVVTACAWEAKARGIN
uniref:Uncharacterized protein n=1 Tax=Oryza punctata TaxID=4537 RepID=A0A0E0M5K3_ORYPU